MKRTAVHAFPPFIVHQHASTFSKSFCPLLDTTFQGEGDKGDKKVIVSFPGSMPLLNYYL